MLKWIFDKYTNALHVIKYMEASEGTIAQEIDLIVAVTCFELFISRCIEKYVMISI